MKKTFHWILGLSICSYLIIGYATQVHSNDKNKGEGATMRSLEPTEEEDYSGIGYERLYAPDEPFPKALLGDLQKNIPLMNDRSDRVQSAAVLYRYGIPFGKDYLMKAVEAGLDETAAAILIINKEIDALPLIRAMLLDGANDESESGLFLFMAHWRNSKVTDMLIEVAKHRPEDQYLLMALVLHGRREFVPSLEKIYAALPMTSQDKALIGAALSASGLANSDEPLNFLKARISEEKQSNLYRAFAIDAVETARESKVVPELRAVVTRYLQSSPTKKKITEEVSATTLAVKAADALVVMGDNSDTDKKLVERLFYRLSQSSSNEDLYLKDLMADVLVNNGNYGVSVKKIMGAKWFDQRKRVSSLRSVPNGLLMFNEKFLPVIHAYLPVNEQNTDTSTLEKILP